MVGKHAQLHALIGGFLIVIFLLSTVIIRPEIAPEFSGRAYLRVIFDEPQEYGVVAEIGGEGVSVERSDEREYAFSFAYALSGERYAELRDIIAGTVGPYTVVEYQSFSPSVSRELVRKSFIALFAASLIIIGYIAFVFRGVSRPVRSWKYGVVATVALAHDTLAPLGIFSLIAPFTSASVDTLFVTALLATLGYSINDTIVIFDRIRERLRADEKNREPFSSVVDRGVRDSLRRSVYTSVSTMIPLILLFVLVPVTKWFSVALFIGVAAGTYSSLFFAPSLLLLWNRYFPQREETAREPTDTEKAEEALRGTLYGSDTL